MESITAHYDPITGGLFQSDINPLDSIPVTAIELLGGAAERESLYLGRAEGKIIELDVAGYPCLKEPPPPTQEQLHTAAMAHQAAMMAQATVAIAPLQDAAELGIASEKERVDLAEWRRYRVDLNRIEQQSNYPFEIDWPHSPTS